MTKMACIVSSISKMLYMSILKFSDPFGFISSRLTGRISHFRRIILIHFPAKKSTRQSKKKTSCIQLYSIPLTPIIMSPPVLEMEILTLLLKYFSRNFLISSLVPPDTFFTAEDFLSCFLHKKKNQTELLRNKLTDSKSVTVEETVIGLDRSQ